MQIDRYAPPAGSPLPPPCSPKSIASHPAECAQVEVIKQQSFGPELAVVEPQQVTDAFNASSTQGSLCENAPFDMDAENLAGNPAWPVVIYDDQVRRWLPSIVGIESVVLHSTTLTAMPAFYKMLAEYFRRVIPIGLAVEGQVEGYLHVIQVNPDYLRK
jgi:hypothetical protein